MTSPVRWDCLPPDVTGAKLVRAIAEERFAQYHSRRRQLTESPRHAAGPGQNVAHLRTPVRRQQVRPVTLHSESLRRRERSKHSPGAPANPLERLSRSRIREEETESSALRLYLHRETARQLAKSETAAAIPLALDAPVSVTCQTRASGNVHPNPLVGAVIVRGDGVLMGEGWHAEYGGPHAEVRAIADAIGRHGAAALKDATLYCNLEPCNHFGRTPPCSEAILQRGIPRVVIGCTDPNPKASGGMERLRRHGVEVTFGVEEGRCRRLNEAFLHSVATGRPLVCLKVAQTLDGRVAAADGTSRWITGKEARSRVHVWRAGSDGVLVGAGTAQRDDPSLTVRHVAGNNPRRYVLDRTGSLRTGLKLFTDCDAHRTTALVGEGAPSAVRRIPRSGRWPHPAGRGARRAPGPGGATGQACCCGRPSIASDRSGAAPCDCTAQS